MRIVRDGNETKACECFRRDASSRRKRVVFVLRTKYKKRLFLFLYKSRTIIVVRFLSFQHDNGIRCHT